MARIFIPNPNKKPEVHHKDGIKTNNKSDNLEWATHVENMKHANNMGLLVSGDSHGRRKINSADAGQIKQMIAEGQTNGEIANKYNLTKGAISLIRAGKNWKCVT